MQEPDTRCDRTACLLVNLGTPDAPEPAAVRRYLREFLSDRRVVEAPRLVWWLVLNCLVLPFRPARVARLYQSIWEQDSPIRKIGYELAAAVQARLDANKGEQVVKVELAMTYGQPSLRQSLQRLVDEGVRRIIVLPLFPQYSGSTTAAVYDQCSRFMQQQRDLPELHLLRAYPCEPNYIAALAESVRAFRAEHGQGEKLLMSFHGIPQQYAEDGDPYPRECETTARLLAEQLGLQAGDWQLVYQSRFGPKAWLQPYADITLQELAREGVQRVDVICPGFSADCLETLEEVAQQYRELFVAAGGNELRYIPALNATSSHAAMITGLLQRVL